MQKLILITTQEAKDILSLLEKARADTKKQSLCKLEVDLKQCLKRR